MPNIETVSEIFSRHQFNELNNRLAGLEADRKSLVIGVLGEFSAGKSTLINAMLGRNLLPAMEKPTTARITEIVPEAGLEGLRFYLKDEQGGLKQITVLEFDDALLSSGKEVAVVKAPGNDLLLDGYCIVDTPGLASLEETHTDITFGYLPILDGAIVCQDINKGGLTASLRAFLSKREVRPFLTRIVFVLTRTDTKQPASAEAIRQGFVAELHTLAEELRTPIQDLDARVLSLSPMQMLEQGNGRAALSTVFENVFAASRAAMTRDRIAREREALVKQAIVMLHDKYDNLALDRSQYAGKRKELQEEIAKTEATQHDIHASIDQLKPQIMRLVDKQVSRLMTDLSKASQQELTGIITSYLSEIEQGVNELLKSKFDHASTLVVDSRTNLQSRLEKLANAVDMGKFVATAAIVAALFPEPTTASSIATAATGEVIEGAIGAKVISSSRGSRLGDFIKTINPAEHIGNFIHAHQREKMIHEEVSRMGADITLSIIEQLKEIVDRVLIQPTLLATRTSRQHIDELLAEERLDEKKIEEQRAQIKTDILALAQ